MPSVEEPVKPESTLDRATLWPVAIDPTDPLQAARDRAARAVDAAVTGPSGDGDVPASSPSPEVMQLVERILAQEHQSRSIQTSPVVLEAISASGVVAAARSPEAFAAALRRPMPQQPNRAARRGTRFHAFVEQHYGHAAMLDWDELPGSADVETDLGEDEAALAVMKEHFLSSEWADRTPIAIETDVETVLPTSAGPVSVRGRIDAVFARPDGGVTIVDWKSGGPGSANDLAARAIQLGVYALAWERIHGLDPGSVDVAFYFAATGETVWPELPSETAIREVLESVGNAGHTSRG